MKKYLLIIILSFAFSCSKKDKGPCYDCTAIGSGNNYTAVVCTDDGNPEDEAPQNDLNGTLSWTCHPR